MLDAEDCWRSLKSITIHSIANSSYMVLVRLSELILQKALVLNELVFYYKGKDQLVEGACNMKLEKSPKFFQQLSTLPTASQRANILLHKLIKKRDVRSHGTNRDLLSKFVLTVPIMFCAFG